MEALGAWQQLPSLRRTSPYTGSCRPLPSPRPVTAAVTSAAAPVGESRSELMIPTLAVASAEDPDLQRMISVETAYSTSLISSRLHYPI